jgi:hypothetical protein
MSDPKCLKTEAKFLPGINRVPSALPLILGMAALTFKKTSLAFKTCGAASDLRDITCALTNDAVNAAALGCMRPREAMATAGEVAAAAGADALTEEEEERNRKVRAKAAARERGHKPTVAGAAAAAEKAAVVVATTAVATEAPAAAPAAPTAAGCFSLEQLQLPAPFPDSVDPAKRETYLEDSIFQAVFGMDRAGFGALPGWKRTAAKKKHGLF